MKPEVSIIIPIYNAEKFISDCLDSILNQVESGYEVVLVDDGSTDGSKSLLETYANSYPQIKLCCQPNGGATAARSNGIHNASGEWITFVDADDLMTSDAIGVLKQSIRVCERDVDIVVFSMPTIGRRYTGKYISIEEFRRAVIERTVYTGPWGKLFRRSIFSDWVMDIPRDVVVAEDMLMNIRLSFSTDRPVRFMDSEIYRVRQSVNDQSAMKIFRGGWNFDVIFDKYLVESIPVTEWQKYRLSVLKHRLNIWNGTFRKRWIIPKSVHETDYYRAIVADMRVTGYYGGPLTYINVMSRSPLVRMPMDMLWRAGGVIRRYVTLS